MKKNLKWGIIILIIIGIIGLGFGYTYSNNDTKEVEEEEELIFKDEKEKEEEKEVEKVYVDIKGAVTIPGVYEIESDKKVIDVVNQAGGLAENADTSLINLAKKVSNEMVIIIYTTEEVKKAKTEESIAKVVDNTCVCPKITNDACINNKKESSTSKSSTSSSDSDTNTTDIININTATVSDFDSLPGVGESKAEAIVEYREKNGNFTTIEDIKQVSGIGDALFEKIKDYLTV